jgi:hypothetical protein
MPEAPIPILGPEQLEAEWTSTDSGEPLPNLFDGFLPALTKAVRCS